MGELARIGIAISEELLEEFDRLIERRGYTNRSEAFRDLVRNELVGEISGSANRNSRDFCPSCWTSKVTLIGFIG